MTIGLKGFQKGHKRFAGVLFKKGHSGYWLNKKRPEIAGSNNYRWSGGLSTTDRQKVMSQMEYRQWRRHVFQRDDYTCQACSQRGGKLNADHELPYSIFPELRFEILNGRTLCIDCHRKTSTWGTKLKTYEY